MLHNLKFCLLRGLQETHRDSKRAHSVKHLPPTLAREVPSLDLHSGRQEPQLQIVL